MEKKKTKDDLKITTGDLKGLQRQQNRYFGEMWEPGSVLDRFEDALNQLSENKKKILFLHHVENETFKVIATEVSLPYHEAQHVKNIHDESMNMIVAELGLSEDEIGHLFNFKDLQDKALKVINVLSL